MILFYAVVLVPTFGCLKQDPISEEEISITNELELKFSEAVAENQADIENENFEEYEKIVNSVIKYVKDESLYLDADLKLNSLSEKCNIPSYQISKSINFILNKNFNEFINDFRIIESKRKLSSAEFEHVTILAIALESGFNSKSSFNAQFKKRENTTPNEHRRTHSAK
jgi:AraC-like DNA-binding protein